MERSEIKFQTASKIFLVCFFFVSAENEIREKERQKQKATKAFDDLDTNKDQKFLILNDFRPSFGF